MKIQSHVWTSLILGATVFAVGCAKNNDSPSSGRKAAPAANASADKREGAAPAPVQRRVLDKETVLQDAPAPRAHYETIAPPAGTAAPATGVTSEVTFSNPVVNSRPEAPAPVVNSAPPPVVQESAPVAPEVPAVAATPAVPPPPPAPAEPTPVVQTPPPQPAPPAPVASATPSAPGPQCAGPYVEKSPSWYPGLPGAPSTEAIYTDMEHPEDKGLRYTDGQKDGLMALAVERSNALPATMQVPSRAFSKHIQSVSVQADYRKSGDVKVSVVYEVAQQKTVVELKGKLVKRAQGKGADSKLTQIASAAGQPALLRHFAGLITCADFDHGCKNVLLRFDLTDSKAKVLASAYIVHRWAIPHLTMSDDDRRNFARYPNKSQTSLTEYLANTKTNLCLAIVADVRAGRRKLPVCTLQTLQAECGGEEKKIPAATSFGFRSWAAAYGHSGFELIMAGAPYNAMYELSKQNTYMSIRGPLAHNVKPPMTEEALTVTGNDALEHAYLMNNDGAGNLNFQFDFKGTPAAHTRLSFTSLLPDVAHNHEVELSARQMPAFEAK